MPLLPFEGEVLSDSFHLRRIIHYGNSFLPRIRGRIIATTGGSIVEGTMSLHPIVLSFMIFWFAVLLLMGGGVWASMLKQGDWQPVALVPLGVIAFGGLLTSVAFTLEARKARALLVKLIAPSSVSPRAPSAIA